MNDQPRSELIHEIRNQLAVARANLEAFADGKLEPSRERLESLLQTISHLERLTSDLTQPDGAARSTTAPATAKPQIQRSHINVCGLLFREFNAMDALAKQKKIALSVTRCAAASPSCLHFYGDPDRIGQIVHNVLLNAVKYTPEGGKIHIDCSRRADQIDVMVEDTGTGINARDLEHVFELGFRGNAGRGASGSGYGLAISKELVEAHGGSIEVAHSSPSGTRFIVTLPAEPQPA